MASVGHVLVGAAAARFDLDGRREWRAWLAVGLAWSALSLLPDVDVVGFLVGVPYEAPFGHRGATHSFAFACAVALVVWVVTRARRTALLALAVVASHPLLDTLTDGGLGCALLWPVRESRFFAPWRPLPVAPIGPAFLSAAGARVALAEIIALSPFAIYTLWPRRERV